MTAFRAASLSAVLPIGLLLSACGAEVPRAEGANAAGHTAPTAATIDANRASVEELVLDDASDFEQAARGLIAKPESLIVQRADGTVIWNQDQYAFEIGEAPDSVHPSLWRQAQLNAQHGLYKVTDRIYQLRGFDLANMTLIEGDSGWIIVDPLTVRETAAAAWDFAMQHLPAKPIKAVLFTHSHVDHFGGVTGILDPANLPADLRVIAPGGFTEEATSENLLAGVAMQRRASYQYGRRLARDERGHVDLGLGKEVPFGGQIGFLEPAELVDRTPQAVTIDGIEFQFQFTPGSEAPSEFTFYLPQFKAYCGAEVVSRNLHNIYTLRGAKVRDALAWSDYIHEALRLFGAQAEIYFASHHWPIWGNEQLRAFLRSQRDTYKYIHDQTVRLANHGYTPREIAEQLQLPESLRSKFSSRGYYGTVSHNAKAVYQHYFGWYDANPANLNPLPPEAAGARYVEAMGGAAGVIEKARSAVADGDYRWAAELLNHLVFADPDNAQARSLLAQVYDQLGYQSESGPWRDVYLSAAYELRHGGPEEGFDISSALDMLRAVPLHKFFVSMAARLNGPKAEGKDLSVNFIFSDRGEGYHLWIENAVLHSEPLDQQAADVTLTVTHELFLKMAIGTAGIRDTLLGDDLTVEGSRLDLVRFFSLFDKPDGRFGIVVP